MSEQPLFRTEPYRRTLETSVTAVDEQCATTQDSIFYPAGGGQPGDTGQWQTEDGGVLPVTDTRYDSRRRIVHDLGPNHGLRPGMTIRQTLDWPRRHAHMRMHTALHLLSVAIPYGVTGGRIAADKGRLDFDLGDTRFEREAVTEQLRELIAGDHPVTTEWISETELDAQPALVKTMSVAPPRGVGDIRMVRIGDLDYQPCGGTHVASTAEIGAIEVASIKNRGARNRRVTLRWRQAGAQP